MKINTNPIRGCLDFAPTEAARRQAAINIILQTYKDNGFLQIKTPVLESLDLLIKSDSGDNATQLMFKTIKRGEKLDLKKPGLTEEDIAEEGLRYDLTVPLARFFAGHKSDLPSPFRSIQIDDSFRAERPQKGRFRQFTQCDIDIFGDGTILAETELISTALCAYKNLGLKNLIIKINSRKILRAVILKAGFDLQQEGAVCIVIDKIDKIGLEGCRTELAALGFDAEKTDRLCELLKESRRQGIGFLKQQKLAEEEVRNLDELLNVLKENIPADYSAEFDIGIVRGQSYYTGFVFEVFQLGGEYKGAVGGGGRYDTMLEKMLGESIPAVGFGMGLDTVLLVLDEQGIVFKKGRKKLALIYEKAEPVKKIMEAKRKYMKDYEISVFVQPKNMGEFTRKIKLAGFDGMVFLKTGKIELF